MIAYLSGKPYVTQTGTIIICHGVGYAVNLSASAQIKVREYDSVDLFIYAHIKEDAFDLYGFLQEDEKLLFLKLISVDGVGPKTALAIMDQGVSGIVRAVRESDVSFFQSVPRVGKKSAQKIIIELKSKLGGEDLNLVEPVGIVKDAIDALLALGFSENESQKVINTMSLEGKRLEDIITETIRLLTKKKSI